MHNSFVADLPREFSTYIRYVRQFFFQFINKDIFYAYPSFKIEKIVWSPWSLKKIVEYNTNNTILFWVFFIFMIFGLYAAEKQYLQKDQNSMYNVHEV